MLPDPLPIEPLGPFRATITPPGSKSLTNRALLLATLAEGTSTLTRPLWADDTRAMAQALRAIGVTMHSRDGAISVVGTGGSFRGGVTVDIGNAGTAARFLTAACALADEPVIIDGDARMRERPISELVDLLGQLGVEVAYRKNEGCPPVKISPSRPSGGDIDVAPTLSSQYVSALLQIGPLCHEGLTLQLQPPITSAPYVGMTLGLMQRFGARIEAEPDLSRIRVEPGSYRGTDYTIEPDASSATYFLAAASLIPGSVATIEGLGRGSIQGDAGFADVLGQMGAGLTFGSDFITVIGPDAPLSGIDVDMRHMPDAAMTLAVVAAFARGPSTLRGLGNLRYKETDRLTALRNELSKVGADVEIDDDTIVVEPDTNAGHATEPITIETYRDHRMAMSFAVAGAVRKGVSIADPRCVEKTYPQFWEDLGRLSAS